MSVLNAFFPKHGGQPTSARTRTMQAVMRILQERGAQGATTGFMMKWIVKNDPALAKDIGNRGTNVDEAYHIQQFKTEIGHALDDWQTLNRVHCDKIGKRKMDGDEVSVPVWRTSEDWMALHEFMRWYYKPQGDSPRQFSKRLQKYFESNYNNPEQR